MNTQWWGWTFPDEHDDPYFDKLNAFARGVDTTVYSLSQNLLPRQTLVLSAYPSLSAELPVTSASDVNGGGTGDGRWTVLSCAPFGRFVGSFSVSGAAGISAVALTLHAGCRIDGGSGFGQNELGSLRVRGVIRGTTVSSIRVPSDSAWLIRCDLSYQIRNQTFVTVVQSLAPGAYSIELQARTRDRIGTGSTIALNVFTPWTLVAVDGQRGG